MGTEMDFDNSFSTKLELILVNLVEDSGLMVLIDDRGIYWSSRSGEGEQHFIEFSAIANASIPGVLVHFVPGTMVCSN